MSLILFLIILIQVVLLVLDLKKARVENLSKQEHITPKSIYFLLFVLLVYSVLHITGSLFVPSFTQLVSKIDKVIKIPSALETSKYFSKTSCSLLVFLLAFYLTSLFDYLVHRFLSHQKLYYHTHRYHHLPKRLFLFLPGILARPFVVAALLPIALGTSLTLSLLMQFLSLKDLNLSFIFALVLLLQSTVGAVTHSASVLENKYIDRVMVILGLTTPKEHLLHHSLEVRGNYGNFVILWDKLFKTYQNPKDYDIKTLTLGSDDGYDYLSAVTFGFLSLNPKQKQKYQISEFSDSSFNRYTRFLGFLPKTKTS